MNRIEMNQIIQKNVSRLKELYQDKWKKLEQRRKKFVADFSLNTIKAMKLDDYVIGSNHHSFCYRIERDLDELGRILGATALKFGVYYGKTKNDPEIKYRYAKRWGNPEEAFQSIKTSICELIAPDITWQDAVKNELSPMLKGKILYIYHPKRFADIYSKEHLEYFVAELNILTPSNKALELQNALIEYRNSWSLLKGEPQFLFNKILYDTFGYPNKNEPKLPLLTNVVIGVASDLTSKKKKGKKRVSYKPDYEEQYKNRKRIGERGEKLVLESERIRLEDAGKDELAVKIKHIADTDDSRGYDILSYEIDGTERQIEVKATSQETINHGFFLTENELNQSQKLDNYYLYIVLDALSENPKVKQIKNPDFFNNFTIKPTQYKVKFKL